MKRHAEIFHLTLTNVVSLRHSAVDAICVCYPCENMSRTGCKATLTLRGIEVTGLKTNVFTLHAFSVCGFDWPELISMLDGDKVWWKHCWFYVAVINFPYEIMCEQCFKLQQHLPPGKDQTETLRYRSEEESQGKPRLHLTLNNNNTCVLT